MRWIYGSVFSLTALCLLAISGSGQVSTAQNDRLAAIHNPICVLPVGQTIDATDIPAGLGEPTNWMSKLDSKLPVSLVSIPATHDAGTALGTFGWSRCQIFTVPAQLKIGIRGFDVRLRVVDDALKVYHSEESQKLDFDAIMQSFKRFLAANTSEFLVMRIREESAAIRSTVPFETAFEKVAQSPEYRGLFYRARSRTEIPTVGQLRGRILILDNFGKLKNAIDYPNSTMIVQDDYDTTDMEKKFGEIAENAHAARAATNGAQWFVNYTSSNSGVVDQLTNAVRVNPRVEALFRGQKGHFGLVLMNFPGVDVIDDLVESNFP